MPQKFQGAVPHMSSQSFMNSQAIRSPTNVSSPRTMPMNTMNTLGQNRMPITTSVQMQSPIYPSTSMATGQLQDGSMISPGMQHQLGQRPMPPQSPLTQQQQLQQHPSQGSNEDMMEIDAESSAINWCELWIF
ncbi:hypothetical protein RirG_000360 [Rhizophagus irregularis DAOM 197198w]|uniref:Uncharacterized protein n=1 Tax=Rhizophagus irregularis (strain DAOM 197198w) TaxID=1432141 RepID=A0A015KDX9_RHIIW|nr:hypothetical protein RirG_000360 [Rhizophagus irregularis DAOM 197198w]